MTTSSFARTISHAALPVAVLLLLVLPGPAGASSSSGPLAYDSFFYGEPIATPTPAVSADATVPLTSVWGWAFPYDGAAEPRYIYAETRDPSGAFLGNASTGTDASGYYAMFDALPVGIASITASYWDRGIYLTYDGVTLVEGGNSVSFFPGGVTWTNARGGPQSGWSTLRIVLGGSGSSYGARTETSQWVQDASGTGVAWALPGELDWGQCYYHDNEVGIWTVGDATTFPVTGGDLSPGSIPFSQETASRMWVVKPRWRSGNPGTLMKLRFVNWPQFTTLNLTGLDASVPVTTWGGAAYDVGTEPVATTLNLRVPATAKVGKFFTTIGDGWATRHEVPTRVSTAFQTSLLKVDRKLIRKGSAVRLRGDVPVWKPGEPDTGAPKSVVIWARARSATDAPAAWNPTAEGWRKVATVRTDRYGRFTVPALRPNRSTTYVCRYPGDDMHFRAYTSLVRVTVR